MLGANTMQNYQTSDIHTLSDFNRKSAEHIKRLSDTGRPEILTVNGKAAAVVIAPEMYDKLIEAAELAKTLQTMNAAKAEHEIGLSKPIKDVMDAFKKELKGMHPNANI